MTMNRIQFAVLATLAAGMMNAATKEHKDPSGFTLQIPDGWQVTKYDRGMVKAASAQQTQFVYIIPILGRTVDCSTVLKRNLEGGWAAFPAANNIAIEPAGRTAAVARFSFKQGEGRGAVLCAETGPRTGMLYAMGAPANQYASSQPVLATVLKSFHYGGGSVGSGGSAPMPAAVLPPMTKWREANEGAYTIPIPQGWKVQGGITRLSNTDVRGGIRVWSPDGASMLQFNDVRLDKVLVMGRQSMPNAQMGRGWRIGPYQTGLQMADWYLRQLWASDLGLTGIEILSRQDRPDLGADADRVPAQMGVRGYQHTFGEVSFRASRQGRPVEGRLLGMTRMLWSPNRDLMGGNFETEIKGYLGPVGSASTLAKIGGYIEGHWEHNYQWVAANRQAAAADVKRTLDQMRASGEMQQKAFWDRMAAADRRAESVNDVLGGRVRLSDGNGNQYEAKSGSNYYFYDEQAGRTAARPGDAVVGTTTYPSPAVDLRPLEVIR